MVRIIRGFHNLPLRSQGCVATIGNFDGIHLGHQLLLKQLAIKGELLELPRVVIIFEPQANEFFTPDKAPARLSRLREKIEILRRYQIEQLCILRFDQRLAQMTAHRFISRLLIDGLDVRYLVVGDDFYFGRNRQGNFALLQQAGQQFGFQVVHMQTLVVNQIRVSSTRIREALKVGDLILSNELLGRPYQMSGKVAHGNKYGRAMGFPTANIHLHRCRIPLQGVYMIQLFGIEGGPIRGVANVGVRPTVNGKKALLEVHLFDFDCEIYGEYVQIYFLHKLRTERRFPNLTTLIAQIKEDCLQAKKHFTHIQG